MFSSALLPVVLALFAQTTFAATCSRQYTVTAGQTCNAISALKNSSTYQLAVVNPSIDSSCSNLEVGQVICLGYTSSDCTKTHVVKDGDVCDSVSALYGIPTSLLYSNNPQLSSSCDNLYIGEVVCVASTKTVPELGQGQAPPPTTVPAGASPAKTTTVVVSTSTKMTIVTTSAPPAATTASVVSYEDLPWCEDGDEGW